MSRREPTLALFVTIALLSLAGVPPLAGFFAKFWIFAAALKAQALWLAVAAAINSVIAFFYYMKVIKTMYLDPSPAGAAPVAKSRPLQLALALCVLGVFAIGLMPGPWLIFAAQSVPVVVKPGDFPWLTVH